MEALIFPIVMGILGVVFKTLQKIIGLQKTFEKANQRFDWNRYWSGEWIALLASILFVVIMALLQDELIPLRPEAAKIIKTLFVLLGWVGADFGFAALGKAKRHIETVIDRKTDALDELKQKENI